MNYFEIFIFLAIFSVMAGIISAILITGYLNKNGLSANIIFWGFYFIRYLTQYKDLTLKKQGKTGPLFYSYIIFFNIALLSIVLGFLLR